MFGRAGSVGIAYNFATLQSRAAITAPPLASGKQVFVEYIINRNATGINPDGLVPVNKTPIQLKVLSLTLLLSGTAYAVTVSLRFAKLPLEPLARR